MREAVFLDRDGVINELVFNTCTGEYEPPHHPDDLNLFLYTIYCLKTLQNSGFLLFIVSNQPDYAKGKTTLQQIEAVHSKLNLILQSENIAICEYYYCYHHPDGIVPEFSFECQCRKPKPYFLLKAAKEHDINLNESWMIGDRDSDIGCGKAAGTKTILIEEIHSSGKRGSSKPDFFSPNLKDALQIILNQRTSLRK